MLKKIILPSILLVLAYGFWVSPDFKEIAAGVSIFLFGMLFLEEGFKAFTGGVLEKLLQKTTDKTWKSLLFGIISTTIMQSSSLVSVITISFISAGLACIHCSNAMVLCISLLRFGLELVRATAIGCSQLLIQYFSAIDSVGASNPSPPLPSTINCRQWSTTTMNHYYEEAKV